MGFSVPRVHTVLGLVGTILHHDVRATDNSCRLRKHKDYIARVYPEHDRNGEGSQASTFLGGLQPALAIFGLIASLTIVFVFTTATWWSTPYDFRKMAVAYGSVSP